MAGGKKWNKQSDVYFNDVSALFCHCDFVDSSVTQPVLVPPLKLAKSCGELEYETSVEYENSQEISVTRASSDSSFQSKTPAAVEKKTTKIYVTPVPVTGSDRDQKKTKPKWTSHTKKNESSPVDSQITGGKSDSKKKKPKQESDLKNEMPPAKVEFSGCESEQKNPKSKVILATKNKFPPPDSQVTDKEHGPKKEDPKRIPDKRELPQLYVVGQEPKDVGTNTPRDDNSEQSSQTEIFTENNIPDVDTNPTSQSKCMTNTLCVRNDLSGDFMCSLYITACPPLQPGHYTEPKKISKEKLENVILKLKPVGKCKITETGYGIILAFSMDLDADNLLHNFNLAEMLSAPVQVARFSKRDTRYRQIVTLKDVPWSIPVQDICSALNRQGISFESVERFRSNVRVEVLDANHYENLVSQGLNFFDAARFVAIPDRWYKCGQNSGQNSDSSTESEGVTQCYRCQGFWHLAATCRYPARCVRCGEPHGVELCPRPRNDPICCHCGGNHHAAYRNVMSIPCAPPLRIRAQFVSNFKTQSP